MVESQENQINRITPGMVQQRISLLKQKKKMIETAYIVDHSDNAITERLQSMDKKDEKWIQEVTNMDASIFEEV